MLSRKQVRSTITDERGLNKPDRASRGGRAIAPEELEADPELWWKERLRLERQHGDKGRGPADRPASTGSSFSSKNSYEIRSEPTSDSDSSFHPGSSPLAPWYNVPGAPGTHWEDGPARGPLQRMGQGLIIRSLLALAVFGGVWGWQKFALPGEPEMKAWLVQAVNEDMDFAAAEAWYERTFGDSPSFLPVFRHSGKAETASAPWSRSETVPPLDGRIIETFAQNGSGVRLSAPFGSAITAVHTGRVTQVTENAGGSYTLLIQHPNRIVTVYDFVDSPVVKPNDWVEAGQTLGSLKSSQGDKSGDGVLFFAVKQGGISLNPADVVPID